MSTDRTGAPDAEPARQSGDDLCLLLTLLMIVLRPVDEFWVQPFSVGLAVYGVLRPRVRASPWFWLTLTMVSGWSLVDVWPLSDNHKYLLCYWCFAIFLSLLPGVPRGTLARSARFLIGAVFLFATLWKGVLAEDFTDDRFFAVTLLTDERFAATTQLFGGLSEPEILEAREYLQALPSGAELMNPPRLAQPDAFRRLVVFATWATLVVEGTLGLAFLLPLGDGRRTQAFRHFLLLSFCVVTYVFAPVAGFGWLLLCLGIAQADGPRLRSAYIGVWLLVLLVTELPWLEVILEQTS